MMEYNASFPIVLKYRRTLGIVFLVLGGINILLWLWLFLLGSTSPVIITGVLVWIIGIGYLKRPYFSVNIDEVVLYNLLGARVKVYSLRAIQALEIEGRQLYVNDGEGRKRIKVTVWMVDPGDWQRLERLLRPV